MPAFVFDIRADKDIVKVDEYIKLVNERANLPGFLNPFSDFNITKIKDYNYVVSYELIYPPVYMLGILGIMSIYLIQPRQYSIWYLPFVLLTLTGVLWSKQWILFNLNRGLHKAGYTTKLTIK